MTFDVYTFCWNEEHLLPMFLHHYRQARRILVLVDDTTSDRSREIVQAAGREIREYSILELDGKALRNTVWKESKGLVDWVITQDPDEFIYFPLYPDNILGGLADAKKNGYQAIRLTAYDMFCTDEEWSNIDPTKAVHKQITRGRRMYHVSFKAGYDKINVFDPNVLEETNFHPGAHYWDPKPTDIKTVPARNIAQMLHLRHNGPERDLKRRIKVRDRLLATPLVAMGIGGAYMKSDEEHANEIRAEYSSSDVIDLTPILIPDPNNILKPKILCAITTRNRYSYLKACLQAVAAQTVKPDQVVLYDDSEKKEMLEQDIMNLGINMYVTWTSGNGFHEGHQTANTSGFDLIWRLNDDCIPEPDVLEKLLGHMTPSMGAVAGAVYNPLSPGSLGGNTKITKFLDYINDDPTDPELIKRMNHVQLTPDSGIYEDVDFLYLSFLYRGNIADYKEWDISPMGFHEDIIFTYRLKRAGYKLLVDTSIKTQHIPYATGGCNDGDISWRRSAYMWDQREFLKIMTNEWGIK